MPEWKEISSFKILTGKPTVRDLSKGLDVDRRTMLKWILKEWLSMRIWVDSAQVTDYWRALLNAALNLRVP